MDSERAGKILIVEDDTDLQEGLPFSLEMEEYEVAAVSTLYQAQ